MSPLIFASFQALSPNGVIGSSWRDPSNTQTDYLMIEHWTELAKKLESGGFDFLFFADTYGYPTLDGELIPFAVEAGYNVPMADPITIVSAIAAATSKLGVVLTNSTTHEKPAALARRFATLDHFTKGRIGWNIVSGGGQSSSTALFGEPMIPHDERYLQADDYLQICLRLWEASWADDALRVDREAGVYAEPDGVRQVSYEGKYLRTKGILTLPPSPQRTPLLLQAGTSSAGRDFAARYAECVFVGGGDPAVVARNITAIRDRAEEIGRPRDSVKFLVGAGFVVGTTEAEAQRKYDNLLGFATLKHAAATFAWSTGVDLLKFDLDKPLPEVHSEIGQTNLDRFRSADGTNPTVREILEDYRQHGINGTTFIGTPEKVADEVEAFVAATGADGFLVQQHITPGTHDDFIELLRPELLKRDLMRPTREDVTLREQLLGAGPRVAATHPGAELTYRTTATADH
ncbi:NtaA/DmoA family FMN-dependent monooxygenase [Streptomyces sp. NPDC050263]|uniref:NtaA/DmoA family FMN-dependent monooxygenase n=1 Tax=Streptomyces sp. NPDC050263 TaxID=3155037 RepID=UPI00342CDFCB